MKSKKAQNGIAIIIVIILLLFIIALLILALTGNIPSLSLLLGRGSLGKVEAPIYEPTLENNCKYYDLSEEFRNAFGNSNIDDLRLNCLAIGGIWTEGNSEMSCYWDPSAFALDCNDESIDLLSNFCEEGLLADWHCDNSIAYVGCECQRSLPSQWDSGSDDDGDGDQEPELNDVRIFVTANAWNGAMGTLNGMDEKCQVAAYYEDLGTAWIALASDTSTDASSRIPEGRYVRLDGVKIADNKLDLLDGSIDNKINVDERLEKTEGLVWTGTFTDGLRDTDNNCNNWQWVSQSGKYGASGSTSPNWIEAGIQDCDLAAHIYCIEAEMLQ